MHKATNRVNPELYAWGQYQYAQALAAVSQPPPSPPASQPPAPPPSPSMDATCKVRDGPRPPWGKVNG